MPREWAQAAPTARPKVPMRRLGADCLVVAWKRGNARRAKGAGHRRWIGSTDVRSTDSGRSPILNGRRQPSCGGTSRMNREAHVRFCEGLGVKFPGPTRPWPPARPPASRAAYLGKPAAAPPTTAHASLVRVSTPGHSGSWNFVDGYNDKAGSSLRATTVNILLSTPTRSRSRSCHGTRARRSGYHCIAIM